MGGLVSVVVAAFIMNSYIGFGLNSFLLTLLALLIGLVAIGGDLIESATEMYHGHVSITAEGYRERKLIQLPLSEDEIPGPITASTGVRGFAGRVHGAALLSCGEGDDSRTYPAMLMGIDPEEEAGVTRLAESIASITPSVQQNSVQGDRSKAIVAAGYSASANTPSGKPGSSSSVRQVAGSSATR